MNRMKGIAMIVSGATFWGATGPMMEWLLRNTEMSVSFMLTIRLLLAGMLLLTVLKGARKENYFALASRHYGQGNLLIFGIVGMLGVQFAFVASIDYK